ncbi:hypothetical protein ACF0H5_018737 [Mactra antiquata]
MHFDLLYEEIGEFGIYAKYVVLIGSLSSTYAGLLFINTVFTLAIPKHRCALPGWNNDTYAVQDIHHFDAINRTIPHAAKSLDYEYDKCHYKEWKDGEVILRECNSWVYDRSIFKSSLAADMNMVCDRVILKSNAQMIFFSGFLAGSLLTGMFSDRFGRKTTTCLSSIFYVLVAISITWTPSYSIYVLLNFSVGFFAVGNFMPVYVTCMEFVGPSKRRLSGSIGSYYWVMGNMCLAGLAYAIRDWQHLQIACAAPGILFQLFWIIYPESPRWLLGKGRQEEAKVVLRKAAKWSKVDLSEKVLDNITTPDDSPFTGTIFHLFKYKSLLIRTLVVYFNWLVVCITYYGLAFNSADLYGDIYLNFFLQCLMDLPATTMVLLVIDRSGRKALLCGCMFISGIGCLSTIFTILYAGEEYTVSTSVLVMIAKFGASAAFSTVYIYTGELYPTSVRNSAMGSSSMMARVGGMIAPYVADLDRLVSESFGKALPQVVFGTLCIIAGLLALMLPETLNKTLPETVEDCRNLDMKIEVTIKNSTKGDESHVNKAFEDEETNTKL